VPLPERIAPGDQPLAIYRGKTCETLTAEQSTLSRQLADAEDQQRAAHQRQVRIAATLGVLPIVGPSQNLKDEIAAMKGQLLALAMVGEEKSCRLRKVDLDDPDLRRAQPKPP